MIKMKRKLLKNAILEKKEKMRKDWNKLLQKSFSIWQKSLSIWVVNDKEVKGRSADCIKTQWIICICLYYRTNIDFLTDRIRTIEATEITREDIQEHFERLHSNKSPDRDGSIQGFLKNSTVKLLISSFLSWTKVS